MCVVRDFTVSTINMFFAFGSTANSRLGREGCVGGRILVRELVSNPMNRTCLVGTWLLRCQRVSTPSCACTRVSTRTLAVAQYVGGCSSVDESRGNVFSELWIQVRLKCGRFKYAGLTVSSDVIKAEESWGGKSC